MDRWNWLFKKRTLRRAWHICYGCMTQNGNDTERSVFYSEGPPVLVLGRPWMPCRRCGSTNTKSLQNLKDEGSDAAFWGLEQIVRKLPRREYEFKTKVAAG
ncbi:MAG: hypothetical protein ACLQOO_34590 [Terriglobia bacterium]